MELIENFQDGAIFSVTCKIMRKDRAHPTVVTEYLSECIRNTDPWKKPVRMLRHKAAIQCARYAFGLGGIMEQDEAEAALGERDVTPRQEPQASQARETAMPAYDAAAFEKNLPVWRKHIEAGSKTAEQVIATVETKGTLTDEQKQKIRDLTPIEGDVK